MRRRLFRSWSIPSDARIRLEQDGINVASITEVRSPTPADAVVAWDPPAQPRPRVSLLINREEAATFVAPDVIGTKGDRAATGVRAVSALHYRAAVPQVLAGTVVQPAGRGSV
jgi:hypothetical protein